jgi:RNA polymerase sigma-70 factor (ECF subfamily)
MAVPSVRERLLRVARAILRDELDAEDAVHDAFVLALRGADGFRGEAQASTWLHRVTVNAALGHKRKRQRFRKGTGDPGRGEGEPAPLEAQADPRLVANVLLEAAEETKRLRAALAELPAAYGEAVQLCVFDELPLPAAARALGIKPSAVRTRIWRAREHLRQRLAA